MARRISAQLDSESNAVCVPYTMFIAVTLVSYTDWLKFLVLHKSRTAEPCCASVVQLNLSATTQLPCGAWRLRLRVQLQR